MNMMDAFSVAVKMDKWRISKEGLDRLGESGRLEALAGQSSLMWKRYEDEVPGRRIHNLWGAQMSPTGKRYVVQTANKVIQRAILMTSDPGDLVLDPDLRKRHHRPCRRAMGSALDHLRHVTSGNNSRKTAIDDRQF